MLTQKDINEAHRVFKAMSVCNIDIDQKAASLLNAASLAAKAILERRQQMDSQGLANEPLIVLAGEKHSLPSNHLFNMLVLNTLKKTEPKTAFALEQPHDSVQKFWINITKEFYKAANGPSKAQNHYRDDALVKFSSHPSNMAPYSRNILLYNCMAHDIAVIATDASRHQNSILDTSDRSTRKTIKSCLDPVPTDPIHIISENGLQIRNHHMAITLDRFAKEYGPRIIVQQTGAAHVAGTEDDPSEQSLAAALKMQGSHVLTYYLSHQNRHKRIAQMHNILSDKELVSLPILPAHEALYQTRPLTGHYSHDISIPATMNSFNEEAAYTNIFLDKMGLRAYGLNHSEYHNTRQEALKELKSRVLKDITP